MYLLIWSLVNKYQTRFHDYRVTRDGLFERQERTKAILDHLRYPEMEQRSEAIHATHEGSFQRAFARWSGLLTSWLESEEHIFWVTGKAGSGKSTFMKFLQQHDGAKDLLEKWSQGHGKLLVTAAHYFWYAGTSSLQRSHEGLLRSLLFSVVSKVPEVLPLVLPVRWHSDIHRIDVAWTEKELTQGMHNLSLRSNTTFVLSIDGLDEYYPAMEHGTVVRAIQEMARTANIRLCVSSRPWQTFESHFGPLAACLRLHQLTEDDIRAYITKQLRVAEEDAAEHTSETNKHFNGCVISMDAQALIGEIMRKSEGVFLWVQLVMKTLHDEMCAGKELSRLHVYVDEMPDDLESYFSTMIYERIGWRRESEVAKVLKVVAVLAEAAENVTEYGHRLGLLSCFNLWHLSTSDGSGLDSPGFAEHAPIEHLPDSEFRRRLKILRSYIARLCKDLVKVTDEPNPRRNVLASSSMHFLHRTVFDWLVSIRMKILLDEHVPPHFQEADFVAKLTLARLKSIPSEHESAPLADYSALVTEIACVSGAANWYNNGRSTLSNPNNECSHLGVGLVSHYEMVVVHCLTQFRHPRLGPAAHDISLLELFLSYGLCTYFRHFVAKCPELLCGHGLRMLWRAISTLFVDPGDGAQQDAIKVMLAHGLYCPQRLWHTLLGLWWNHGDAVLGAQHDPTNNHRPTTTVLHQRIWTVAKMLIQSGADLSTHCCVAHVSLYQRPHCHLSGPLACRSDSANCLQYSPADILDQLIAPQQRADLEDLVAAYSQKPVRQRLAIQRRAKQTAYFGREEEPWIDFASIPLPDMFSMFPGEGDLYQKSLKEICDSWLIFGPQSTVNLMLTYNVSDWYKSEDADLSNVWLWSYPRWRL